MARPINPADLPEDIVRLAEAQIAAGRYATIDDVVRAGVEAIDRYHQNLDAVRAALAEGERSGTFDGDPFESVRTELGITRQ